MHPLLATRGRIILYLLVWLMLAGMLGFLLSVTGRVPLLEAEALMLPLCLVYAFICLAPWYLCRVLPLTQLPKLLSNHTAAAVVVALLWIVLAKLLALGLSRRFAHLDQRFSPQFPLLFGIGVLLYLLAVALHYVLLSVESSKEAETRELAAHTMAKEAELKALKAQINPHFLFNSLNSISALTSIDPTRAREMCVALADFLRLTLGMGEKRVIPLGEEVSLLEKYCAIEKVRFGERLTIKEEIPDDAKVCLLPPLLLQPLFENAVVHGIAQIPEGGWIRLSATRHADRLSVSVENSWDPEAGSSRRNGVGLKNVQRRLEARYGNAANLQAQAEDDVFRVSLVFPAETEEKK